MSRMEAVAQFREIGLPRCSQYGAGTCGRALIWPWQEWICEIEDWPAHHACYHAHLVNMLTWLLDDEAKDDDDYHSDMYDRCRFCDRVTPPDNRPESRP